MSNNDVKLLNDKTILILNTNDVGIAIEKYKGWVVGNFGVSAYSLLSPQHTMAYFPDIFLCGVAGEYQWGRGTYCPRCDVDLPNRPLIQGFVCVDFVLVDHYKVYKLIK